MSDVIKLLPDHVANQIAAGEVVQRPASVVKELLENAVDAGASHIKLIIKNAGKTLIQVIDNGKGMSATDARLSFERHATSKITQADDLFNLHTKGFRGEALASIAAIAHIDLKTRAEDEELGTGIEIEGSTLKSQEPVATPQGTSIAVKNLFFNIPARRNFLKSDAVELRHIIDEFHRVALSHEDIAFVMYNNDGEVFNLPVSNKRQRIVGVFGGKTNEKLVPIHEETEIVAFDGFIVKPEFSKKTKGEQFFFVNDRFIKHAYLNHAVSAAFDGLLPDRARASYFIYMQVAPKTIDINIHPTKTEVKFEDEHSVYTLLRAAVKHSLGQFNIAPVLDFEHDANLDTPYSYKNKGAAAPRVEVDPDFNPFKSDSGGFSSNESPGFKRERTAGWENAFSGLKNHRSGQSPDSGYLEIETESKDSALFEERESEVGMHGGGGDPDSSKSYQLHNKYLVSTLKSGMLIIDQQRAHQRILYEQLLKNITVKESVSQQLLFPLRLDFNATELAIFAGLKESLENTGFVLNIDDDVLEVLGIPSSIQESEVGIVLEQLLDDVQHEVPDAGFSQTDVLAKSMAKSMAVRSGETLSGASRDHLINTLFACRQPNLSPFNKKTFITVTVDELDRKFSI